MTFLAAAASCTSTRVETEEILPEGIPIRLAVNSDKPGTRAMLDGDSFQAEGNALQIWDVYFSAIQEPKPYIDGKFVVSGGPDANKSNVWPFRPSITESSVQDHYYWTKTGVHRFYGVLVNDNSTGASLAPASGWGFDADHKVYSVPETKLDLESEQFDFVYSNVIERDLDNGGTTASVPLRFSHLFSAFGFTLKNDSPSPLILKSVALNVDNVASAEIDYSRAWDSSADLPEGADGWTPSPSYSDRFMSPASGIGGIASNLASSECRDLFKGNVLKDSELNDYMAHTLMWPQNLAGKTLDVSYEWSGKKYVEVEVTVNKYEYTTYSSYYNYNVQFTDDLDQVTSTGDKSFDYDLSNGHYVYVGRGKGQYAVRSALRNWYGNYTLSTIKDKETQLKDVTEEKELFVKLADITPGGRWNAGNRYLYNLVYSDNEIGLTVTVMKWDGDHGGDVTFE